MFFIMRSIEISSTPNDLGLSSEARSASSVSSRMLSGIDVYRRHALRAPWITAMIVTCEVLNL